MIIIVAPERQISNRKKPGGGYTSNWTCGYCGKQFKNEYYLDMHLENAHMDQIQPNRTVCLADYCEIFDVCDKDPLSASTPLQITGDGSPN